MKDLKEKTVKNLFPSLIPSSPGYPYPDYTPWILFYQNVGGIAAASSTFAVNGYRAVFLKKLLDVCAKLIVQYIDIDAARYMAFGIFGYRAYINQLDGLVLYHFLKLVGG